MVVDSIREFNRAVPFVPYELHLASGERYRVPHPDFISISPRGSFVVLIDRNERPHHLNALSSNARRGSLLAAGIRGESVDGDKVTGLALRCRVRSRHRARTRAAWRSSRFPLHGSFESSSAVQGA